jgi:hypothetical protein
MGDIKNRLEDSEAEKEKLTKAYLETAEINKKLKEILTQKDQIIDRLTQDIQKVSTIKAEFEPILQENSEMKKLLGEKDKELLEVKTAFEKAAKIMEVLPELQKHLKESQDRIEKSAEENQILQEELSSCREVETEMKALLDKFQNICQVLTEENKLLKQRTDKNQQLSQKAIQVENELKEECKKLLLELKELTQQNLDLKKENETLKSKVDILETKPQVVQQPVVPDSQELATQIVSGIISGLQEIKKNKKIALPDQQLQYAVDLDINSSSDQRRDKPSNHRKTQKSSQRLSAKRSSKNPKPEKKAESVSDESLAEPFVDDGESNTSEHQTAKQKKAPASKKSKDMESFLCNQIERLSSELKRERTWRDNLLSSSGVIKPQQPQESPAFAFSSYTPIYKPSSQFTYSPSEVEAFEITRVEYNMKQAFLDFEQKMKNLKKRVDGH